MVLMFIYIVCSIIAISVLLIAISVFWETFRTEYKMWKWNKEHNKDNEQSKIVDDVNNS